MESQELVNLFAVAQTFEPIHLAHFMVALLPSSLENADDLRRHAHALLSSLQQSERFAIAFERLHQYPRLKVLLDTMDDSQAHAVSLRDDLIDGIFEVVWTAMKDENCSLREIRQRMILLAADLIVTRYREMTPRARRQWRFEDRAAWVREQLAKHHPRYAELCTDSVLHRDIIRIVTAQLKSEGLWQRAVRKRAPKKSKAVD